MANLTGRLAYPGFLKLGIVGSAVGSPVHTGIENKVSANLGSAETVLANIVLGTVYDAVLYTGQLATQLSRLARVELASNTFLPVPGSRLSILNFSQSLNFNQNISRGLTKNVSFSQTLTFIHNASRFATFYRSNNQTLNIIPTLGFVRSKPITINQTLSFGQVLTKSLIATRTFKQNLNLNQQLNRQMIYSRLGSNTLTFNNFTYKVTQLKGITLQIPNVILTVKKQKCVIIMQTNDLSIVLPCPILGDTLANTDEVILKRSMNNILYSYVKRIELKKFKYSFILGRLKSLELRQFLISTLEKIIILTNWLGEKWYVNILTNPMDLVPKSRYENERERIEISLEFEGIKIAG